MDNSQICAEIIQFYKEYFGEPMLAEDVVSLADDFNFETLIKMRDEFKAAIAAKGVMV